MDYLLVVHDQTFIMLVRPKGFRSVGALGGIRTPNLLIRSQMLYPLSYERRLEPGQSTGGAAASFCVQWRGKSTRYCTQNGAEREGFEPSDPVSQVNSLAVSPIRPLSHLSSVGSVWHTAGPDPARPEGAGFE